MRFMIIRKADKNTESGVMPSQELLTAMMNYNETLVKAGVMLQTIGNIRGLSRVTEPSLSDPGPPDTACQPKLGQKSGERRLVRAVD